MRRKPSKMLGRMSEAEIGSMMQEAAVAVDHIIPMNACFTILVSSESDAAQYISNAVRSDMIKAMRSAADRLEAKEDLPR